MSPIGRASEFTRKLPIRTILWSEHSVQTSIIVSAIEYNVMIVGQGLKLLGSISDLVEENIHEQNITVLITYYLCKQGSCHCILKACIITLF